MFETIALMVIFILGALFGAFLLSMYLIYKLTKKWKDDDIAG